MSATRLKDIQRFYEREGIAFTEDEGVRWKAGSVNTYQGRSGFLDFIMDVYQTMKSGGDVCVSSVNEDDFLKWEGDEAEAHMARMASIENLTFKILIKEGDDNTISKYAQYRTVPSEYFGDVPLYIYGDKTALIVFAKDDVEIFVIEHSAITQYFRDRFSAMWSSAKEV